MVQFFTIFHRLELIRNQPIQIESLNNPHKRRRRPDCQCRLLPFFEGIPEFAWDVGSLKEHNPLISGFPNAFQLRQQVVILPVNEKSQNCYFALKSCTTVPYRCVPSPCLSNSAFCQSHGAP